MSESAWHLKKEVNIGHLFATVGLLISAVLYSGTLDKRIQANAQNNIHSKEQRLEDVARAEKRFDAIIVILTDIQQTMVTR